MEKKFLEGSDAIAEMVALCSPEVVAAYPITPQTHIVEALSRMKGEGKLNCEYLYAESEFTAISMVLGASTAGSRVYTATTSQGLLLMTEVIYNFSGMKIPCVMTVANRAIGAPLNIWNDQQDGVTMRDTGWIQLFAKTMDEAILMHLAAFKITEELRLPVMVNMDGFILTHTAEIVQIPTAEEVANFLPKNNNKNKLDTAHPRTFGTYADPSVYFKFRLDMQESMVKSQKFIEETFADLHKINPDFPTSLVHKYRATDAEILFVSAGSVGNTIEVAVDALREKGQKVGSISLGALRPFPDAEILEIIGKAKYVAVIDKSLSVGTEGIFATEIKRAVFGKTNAKVQSFVMGLGGKDISVHDIERVAGRVCEEGCGTQII